MKTDFLAIGNHFLPFSLMSEKNERNWVRLVRKFAPPTTNKLPLAGTFFKN